MVESVELLMCRAEGGRGLIALCKVVIRPKRLVPIPGTRQVPWRILQTNAPII